MCVSCDLHTISYRVILKEDISCAPLNYSGVAVVVIRSVPFPNHPHTPYAHVPILSVIILAFVKSTGKKVDNGGGVADSAPLLSEQDSLEGSLREKVVSPNTRSLQP